MISREYFIIMLWCYWPMTHSYTILVHVHVCELYMVKYTPTCSHVAYIFKISSLFLWYVSWRFRLKRAQGHHTVCMLCVLACLDSIRTWLKLQWGESYECEIKLCIMPLVKVSCSELSKKFKNISISCCKANRKYFHFSTHILIRLMRYFHEWSWRLFYIYLKQLLNS